MAEYLEELDNELGQVFAEFATFLYVTLYDSNSNKMLHNIFLESRRVHIRTLCDFFSNTKKARYPDDLIYRDFLSVEKNLSVEMDDTLRTFINKSTAHLPKKRGQFALQDDDIRQISKDLIKAINCFMREIDNGNLCDAYKENLADKDVQDMKRAIYTELLKVVIVNAQGGEVIQL